MNRLIRLLSLNVLRETRSPLGGGSRALVMAILALILATTVPRAASPDLVISQIYGGGGNAGATLTNDFIELFNRGSVPVNVSGWTVQYTSSAGSAWQTTILSGTVPPGQYYLVQEAVGAGGTTPLPTPDAVGTIAMSATTGKVALVRNSTALSGTCPTGGAIADFVGFGAANCAETTPTGALSNTTAALRAAGGAIDTDNNAADFAIGAPAPRNSALTPSALSGVGAASPVAVRSGEPSLLAVTVSPATGPPSTGIGVTANLAAIGGSAAQPLLDDGTGGDVTAGDRTFSFALTVLAAPGSYTLPVSIADAQGRTASAAIALSVIASPANVVISQVYGGGGNSGAEYRNDFIELRNRELFDVSVAGWSVQYSSSGGSSWAATPLTGTIPAQGYYLVQESAGGGGTLPLPAPDAVGTIAMSATAGKVALVAGPTALTGACPLSGPVVDLVGYGAANCFEGSGPAPTLDAGSAAARLGAGLVDTNDNAADFDKTAPSPRSTIGVPPRGSAQATPGSVMPGGGALLTVSIVGGAFPASPIASVIVDLSIIGGSATQVLFDDGTHGDVRAGDNVYSYRRLVSGAAGFKIIPGVIRDERGRTSDVTIRLAVEATRLTRISELQGSGSTSPLAGQFVTTTGIVTAIRASGFYVQTPDGSDDHDDTTSEGLFVFVGTSSTPPPTIGDEVRLTGVVAEFAPAPPAPPLTELGGGPVFAVVDSGLRLPEPVSLRPADLSPAGGGEQLERFEGMRVRADLLVVAPTDGTVIEQDAIGISNGQFYAVLDGTPRPVREPGLDPGSATPAGLPCCVPRFDGNPERLRVDSGTQVGSSRLELAALQRILGMTGVLDYAFGSYTILPDPEPVAVVGPLAARPVPAAASNELTVASFNLERFFDEEDDPDHDDAVLTATAVNVRLQKASLTVRHVLRLPDILGVVEVENLAILQRLASRINADALAEDGRDPGYVAYLQEGNDIGGIDSGYLVKSSRVDIVAVEQVGKDTTYVPPGAPVGAPLPLLNDRPPLLLKAIVHGNGAATLPLTVIVNHLRSLSGIDGSDGDRIRVKRRAQAEFLASLIQQHQGERVISIGDYNAFQFNDGLVDVVGAIEGRPTPADQVLLASPDLVEPDLTSLADRLGSQQQYSFVFDGNAQALDHVLVNALALDRFSRVTYARSNADFPESLRGEPTRPERLSDHDAIVTYFTFPVAAGSGPGIARVRVPR